MNLLAFDTSSASTIVVATDGDRVRVRRHDPADGERPAHTTAALPLAAELLGDLGLTWDDLERVGIGVGPGSFTGLRSGLSAAAGLARRLGVPLVAVTTHAQLDHAARVAEGDDARVLTVVDGRRKELFVARHDAAPADPSDERAITVIGRGQLATLGALEGALAVGDGAALERDALLALGANVPSPGDALHILDGVSLATLTKNGVPKRADDVRPAYGRQPDAIPTAQRAIAAGQGASPVARRAVEPR